MPEGVEQAGAALGPAQRPAGGLTQVPSSVKGSVPSIVNWPIDLRRSIEFEMQARSQGFTQSELPLYRREFLIEILPRLYTHARKPLRQRAQSSQFIRSQVHESWAHGSGTQEQGHISKFDNCAEAARCRRCSGFCALSLPVSAIASRWSGGTQALFPRRRSGCGFARYARAQERSSGRTGPGARGRVRSSTGSVP
jgi:hypothetical protein